jgi:hypothetical protein
VPRDLTSVVLERACEAAGCPLCRLVLQHERQWLWLLLWERVNDPGSRRELAAAWGFCHRHAWGLAHLERLEWGQNTGTAILYEDLVQRLLAHCRDERRALVLPGQGCPACAASARLEALYLQALVRYGAEAWFAARYQRSDGLCLTHLARAWRAASPAVGTWLLQTARAHLERALSWAGVALRRADPADSNGNTRDGASASALCAALQLLAGLEPRLVEAPPVLGADIASDASAGPLAGCAACVAAGQAAQRSLAALLMDSAPPAAPWLCAGHAWRLYALAVAAGRLAPLQAWSAAGLAAARVELDACLEQMRAAAGRTWLWRWWRRRRPPVQNCSCAICTVERQAGQEQAKALGRAATAASGAGTLCLPHLAMAVAGAAPPVAVALRQRLVARLRELAWELREYLRKSDWQHRDEPRGPEQTAWRRAVALFVGDERWL